MIPTNLPRAVAALFACVLSAPAFAQYPTIPPERQAVMDKIMEDAQKKSDAAFEKARPVIEAQAKDGRPYAPWASRPADLPQATLRAFPGAEGGGAFTPGGRGGKVITVTSLEDSGPGTFREACETGGARIIVFNVSGVIRLKTNVSIRAPYVTIAGQTAPGDGVCITGETVDIDTHDVIIRHMRFRRGITEVTSRNDSVSGEPVGNVIYDHVSASWGCDENLSIYRHMYVDETGKRNKLPVVNVTVQNCISSEGLDTYNHSFGSTLGGLNNAFVRNLYACNTGRNPSMSSSEFNFINNVLFNWYHRTGDGSGRAYNVINNYLKPGPVTPRDAPVSYCVFRANSRGRSAWAYVEGNVVEGNERVSKNNWDGGVQPNFKTETLEADLKSMRAEKPHAMAPVTIMPAQEAYAFVLANAGATLPKRDAVDERIVRVVRTGKPEYVESGNYDDLLADLKTLRQTRRLANDSYKLGIIYDIRQVGGLPEYKGAPYKDSDGDGMPDAWEIKYGLNPEDASDATKDCSGDGYTNIEKYINGIDPKTKVDWSNPENNRDTLAGRTGLL